MADLLGPQGLDVAAPCEDDWPVYVLCPSGLHSVLDGTECKHGCSEPSCDGCPGREEET